jgi:predicted enzyme related to lactoylglutathione lyase
MTTGIRKTGEFCWINMLTPEPAQARAFFSKLLGWTYAELPGNIGHAAQVGGRSIGGLFDLADPNTPKGTSPLIGVMVKVDSADATSKMVTSLGGTAKPPFDVMDQGRMVACTDPNGAGFDVWEPKKGPGTDADSSQHGAPSWFETMTTDVDRATTFYSKLFGWTPEVMPMPGFKYTTFKHGTEYVAGMMQITPEMGKLRPHWATYFTVKDTDETAREAVKLGAKLCVPVQDIPGVGRFCGITSPQGVTFYVIKYTR